MGAFDNAYPFGSGAGAIASQQRWENMGRSLRDSGVLRHVANYLRPTLTSSTTVQIDTGACWIDGIYAECLTAQSITIPSAANGIIVAQANFPSATAEIVYNNAVFTPVKVYNGIWEIVLAQLVSGILYDCRAMMEPTSPIGISMFQ